MVGGISGRLNWPLGIYNCTVHNCYISNSLNGNTGGITGQQSSGSFYFFFFSFFFLVFYSFIFLFIIFFFVGIYNCTSHSNIIKGIESVGGISGKSYCKI
jgi:cellulose synthase/poly-beta-1,6-N-acetylglucosamine synthase-like glycosyltransferase